jgi:hypothetical protein
MFLPNGGEMARCTVYSRERKDLAGDADEDEDFVRVFDPDQPGLERCVSRNTLDDSFVQVRAALQLYAATPAPTPQNGI